MCIVSCLASLCYLSLILVYLSIEHEWTTSKDFLKKLIITCKGNKGLNMQFIRFCVHTSFDTNTLVDIY